MRIRILYVLLTVWGLVSCSSLQTIAFDQLCPAKVSLPDEIRTVAVVNNMPAVPQGKRNIVTIGELNGDGKLMAEALAEVLADSKYFNQVIICDSALNGNPASGTEVRPLSREEVGGLVDELGADVLFSLDRVFIQNMRKGILYPGLREPLPMVITKVTPVLSIYLPVRERPINVIAPVDSLEWNLDRVPSDQDMMEYVADFSADVLSHYLTPYWERTERVYYAGGCVEMRDAAVCLNEGDWEGAKALWLTLFDHRKSGKLKMRAALNLALACEMLGDLDEAKKWMDEAEKRIKPGSQEEMVWKYSVYQLEKREGDFPHLRIQMERFDSGLSDGD